MNGGFIHCFQRGFNVFDIYFDLGQNNWVTWKQVYLYIQEDVKPEKNRKSILQNVVCTQDFLRISYLMERLIEVQYSPLIIGRTGVGKSIVMKHYLNT